MKNKRMFEMGAVASMAALTLAVGMVGCSDDETPNSSSTSSSTSSSSSSSSGGATTLYERLGKHAGIRAALDAIVQDELADTSVAPFFATVGTAGHPTADQLTECLTNQLANAAGGPEAYPGVPADNKGFQCRSMVQSHATLGITSSVFDKFVMIAGARLTTLGVASADVATVAGVLNSTKSDIVTSDAGTGGDAGH